MMFMMELFIRGQKRPRDQYGLVATSDPDDVTCEHLKIRRQETPPHDRLILSGYQQFR